MDVALQHLRSFVAVAEELHFGRAALRLGLSQPQVSRHIRALEAELGVELLTRTSRRAALTPAGVVALEDARETLAAAERLRARAAAAVGGGRVAVAFVWSTLAGYLPPLVAAADGVDLAVSQLRYVEVVPALRRGDVDLAITRPGHERGELLEVPLRREPSLVALSEDHPLAGRDRIPVAALEQWPVIVLRRELAPRVYDAARERGVRIVRDARSPAEALALASAGVGLYRLPASAAVAQPGLAFVELEDAPSRVVLLRRPEPPRPAVVATERLIHRLFDAPDASNDGGDALETAAARP